MRRVQGQGQCGGFKGRANIEGLRAGQDEYRERFKGKGEGWMVQGQGLRRFKGKVNAEGGSKGKANQ